MRRDTKCESKSGWGRPYIGVNNNFKDNFKDILKDNHVHLLPKIRGPQKETHIEVGHCLNSIISLTLGHLDCKYKIFAITLHFTVIIVD